MTFKTILALGGMVLCVLPAQSLFSRDVYFDYSVTAGGNLYQVGDEVNWEINASVVGESRGIKDLSVDLYESRNEFMEAPSTAKFYRPEHQMLFTQFYENKILTSYLL